MKYAKIGQRYGEHCERTIGVYSSQYRNKKTLTEPSNLVKGWYCVQTKIGQEELAQRNLERQGFETYLPMTFIDQRTKLNNNQLEPLFRGYEFMRLSTEEGDWSVIRSTIGVQRLVRFGEQLPACVPNWLIDSLKRRENDLGVHDVKHEYHKGDMVELVNVPYMEYAIGIFEKSVGDRVNILMDIMGKETKLMLHRRNIAPALD